MINSILIYWRQISAFVLLLITVLSLTPLATLPEAPGSDKLHHLLAYSALAFPAALRGSPNYLFLLLIYVLWSGVIEMLQPLVNRHAEILDLVANSFGLLLGALVGILIRKMIANKHG